MSSRNLIAAIILLAALSGAVWWAQKHPTKPADANTPPVTKLVDIPESSVKQVDIAAKGQPELVLKRQGGKWKITAPKPAGADQDAVATMLATLSPLNADSLVTDATGNAAQYGLVPPPLTVKVYQKNGKTHTLNFGNDVAVGSLAYVRLGSDNKIYAVAGSNKSAFDKKEVDLRDKRLLTFDSAKVTSVDITNPKGTVEFAKNNEGNWQIVKPQPMRADAFAVDDLVRKLGDAKMDLSSPSALPQAQSAYIDGTPVGTAKVTDASGTQTLDVRKMKNDYYAKSSIIPGAYKINSDLATDLEKTAADFRNKKLFDFGFSDPTKIVFTQNGKTRTYVRSGTDWKEGGKTLDPGSVQSLIDKLRDLTATGFPQQAFPAATITINIVYDKKSETVEIAKAANGYVAQRANEPAVYQLDGSAVDDILKTNSSIHPQKK